MSELLDLDTLSAGDKVVLAAQLFNEATAESEGIEVNSGVLAAIEERLTHLDENPESGMSWEEVKKSLKNED